MADAPQIVPPPPPPPPPLSGCVVCQTALTPGSRFCLNCGAAIPEPVLPEPEPEPRPPIPAVARPASFLMKLLALLLVFAAMVIAYALSAVRYRGLSAEQFGYAL